MNNRQIPPGGDTFKDSLEAARKRRGKQEVYDTYVLDLLAYLRSKAAPNDEREKLFTALLTSAKIAKTGSDSMRWEDADAIKKGQEALVAGDEGAWASLFIQMLAKSDLPVDDVVSRESLILHREALQKFSPFKGAKLMLASAFNKEEQYALRGEVTACLEALAQSNRYRILTIAGYYLFVIPPEPQYA